MPFGPGPQQLHDPLEGIPHAIADNLFSISKSRGIAGPDGVLFTGSRGRMRELLAGTEPATVLWRTFREPFEGARPSECFSNGSIGSRSNRTLSPCDRTSLRSVSEKTVAVAQGHLVAGLRDGYLRSRDHRVCGGGDSKLGCRVSDRSFRRAGRPGGPDPAPRCGLAARPPNGCF